MKFNKIYFLLTLMLFATEVVIAVYIKDAFVRPYIGDLLVVILIYSVIKTFVNVKPVNTAIVVFIFACLIEVSQYFKLVELLGLANTQIAATVLGTWFSFVDILMYALGTLVIIGAETYFKTKNLNATDQNEK